MRAIQVLAILICIASSLIFPQEGESVALEPRLIRACSTAYIDFREHIAKNIVVVTELDRFMSDIDNYEVTMYSEGAVFVVRFSPKRFQGVHIRGGTASYTVDASGEKIIAFKKLR
jgi:hypothetical protein